MRRRSMVYEIVSIYPVHRGLISWYLGKDLVVSSSRGTIGFVFGGLFLSPGKDFWYPLNLHNILIFQCTLIDLFF